MTETAHNPTMDLLMTRRSVKVVDMVGDGPTDAQLDAILRAGHRVPDHGKIGPWRFIVFKGEARAKFGPTLREAYALEKPEATDAQLDEEAKRFERAPVVVAVIASPMVEHPKVPVLEQLLSVGAACQNMLVAADSFGLAGQWLTEWTATSEHIRAALGCEMDDQIAGFLYFGGRTEIPSDRGRPVFENVVSYY